MTYDNTILSENRITITNIEVWRNRMKAST
jgi:hypothetical protein